jgi:hypothetical protein
MGDTKVNSRWKNLPNERKMLGRLNKITIAEIVAKQEKHACSG